MPSNSHQHTNPVSEADRQARAAFRAYALHFQETRITAGLPVDIAPRTYDRIVARKRDVPPGIARELAGIIRQEMVTAYDPRKLDGWASALEIWAQDCEARHG